MRWGCLHRSRGAHGPQPAHRPWLADPGSPNERGRSMSITVTTTHAVEGRRIAAYLGIVPGEAVMGTNFETDWFAGIRDVSVGRSGSYLKLLNRAKDDAVAHLRERSEEHTSELRAVLRNASDAFVLTQDPCIQLQG